MSMIISNFDYFSVNPEGDFAGEIWSNEIKARIGKQPKKTQCENASIVFNTCDTENKDYFEVKLNYDKNKIEIYANGRRGYIYAIGLILRKVIKCENGIELISDITGKYCPEKQIRGHQLGYRKTPNTYDAWDLEQYRRYYIDLMFFGMNTVEHIPYEKGVSNRNELMKYDEEEFLIDASAMAEEYDIDVSLWHPNNDNETFEEAIERRRILYKKLPRLNVVFPPGGDPGDLPADEFVKRCQAISKVLKESHPHAQMWPSAQAPHSIETWGDDFLNIIKQSPEGIDGVIYGPNHACLLDELRRKVPNNIPIRLYPDISHNVRCEHPVHFDTFDWHFSLNTALSRECTNPRPQEYARLHKNMSQYAVGSVSYSEGITDDVNKAIWSSLDFNSDLCVDEIIADYCRLFFFGEDTEKLTQLIEALEFNWIGDPAENPCIETTYREFKTLYPKLCTNWRFLQLYLRSLCDFIVRYKRRFELKQISKAKALVYCDKVDDAFRLLNKDDDYIADLYSHLDTVCQMLFEQIGLQTDVEKYCADGWERGAILQTMHLPITDKEWLKNRYNYNKDVCFIKKCFERNRIESDEFYYSVALNGLKDTGFTQDGEIYMNFRGDMPDENIGEMHTSLFNIYDNATFKCKISGLTASCDYKLIVSWMNKKNENSNSLLIKADDNTIYFGNMFGETDNRYNNEMLCSKFVSGVYHIPNSFITNGCFDLIMSESTIGVMFAEFKIVKDI